MTNLAFKRKISALLLAALLTMSCAPAAMAESTPDEADKDIFSEEIKSSENRGLMLLANGEATPSEGGGTTPPEGKEATPSEGKEATPSEGKEATPSEGEDTTPPASVLSSTTAQVTNASTATSADGKITGTAEFTGTKLLVAKLYKQSDETTAIAEANISSSSDSYAFTGLAAGNYIVKFFFWGEGSLPPKDTKQVTVSVNPPVNTSPAAISITSVTAGENQLTVKGTAQADMEITVTTNPSSTPSVVRSGADGSFTATIAAPANTYTQVYAKYSVDGSSLVTASGSWVVAAPTTKPTLTVDPVDVYSTTVIAKTTPGVTVKIKTHDYTQTVTADASGLLYFTLPHTYLKGDAITFTVYYGTDSSFDQKATVGAAASYPEIKKGSTGDAVYKLTSRLAALGYPVSPTTNYTDSVVAAVRLFQQANGLGVDGVAGSKTQAVLYSVSAISYGDSIRYPTFVRGDRNHPLIYALQQRLKDLGYYTLKVDGIFGSGTQRAVRDFQRINGLTITGKADNTTQVLLYSSAAKPAGYGENGSYETLKRSSRYQSKVIPLQRRLKALGYYSGSIDGYFGSQTYRAVRNFQRINGINVTGIADPYTQQVLYSSTAQAYDGSTGTSTGYRLLYWGCTGSAVTRLQNALIDAGYKSIVRTADGIFGRWTYDAVRAYQKDHGLAVDGIAGRNTQNSLYGTNY